MYLTYLVSLLLYLYFNTYYNCPKILVTSSFKTYIVALCYDVFSNQNVVIFLISPQKHMLWVIKLEMPWRGIPITR